MSRARHNAKHRASGGKATAYAGGDSNVMKEAHERKRGGRTEHQEGEGEHAKHRADKRARGGKAHERKHGGRMAHHGDGHTSHHEHGAMHAKPHGHHPGRKRGGGVGANLTPLSTAARISEVTKGEAKEDEPKNPKGEPKNP